MAEVHQAPSGGKGPDPPAARAALRCFVAAARDLHDAWGAELEGPTYPRSPASFGGLVRELSDWLDDVEAQPIPPPAEPVALDPGDREAVRAWLADLRNQVADVVAAGKDATRPPSLRDLGRRSARSAIMQAEHAIDALLGAAERGFSTARPPTP